MNRTLTVGPSLCFWSSSTQGPAPTPNPLPHPVGIPLSVATANLGYVGFTLPELEASVILWNLEIWKRTPGLDSTYLYRRIVE